MKHNGIVCLWDGIRSYGLHGIRWYKMVWCGMGLDSIRWYGSILDGVRSYMDGIRF